MRKTIIVALVAVLIIVVAGGVFGWIYFNGQNSNQNKIPAALSVEQICDRSMAYIAANYSGTAQLMPNSAWTGGRQDTGLLGSETYLYASGNWNVSVQYPVVPNPVYSIEVSYSGQNANVSWIGKYNGVISETSNAITVIRPSSTQEDIRDTAIVYIRTYHNETSPYMGSFSWSGGRTTPEGLVGSETYTYQTAGNAHWKIRVEYPVVPNPIYTISAFYSLDLNSETSVVSWQGTLQNGTVTETDYSFTP